MYTAITHHTGKKAEKRPMQDVRKKELTLDGLQTELMQAVQQIELRLVAGYRSSWAWMRYSV